MRNIRIKEESYQRFKLIREKRPQDDNNSQTFEHILEFYEGKQNVPNVTFRTASELLKEKNLAPKDASGPAAVTKKGSP